MFVECWIPLGSLCCLTFKKSESQLNADLCIYTRVSVTVKIMKYQIFSIVKFLDKQTKIQPKRCIHWKWAANFFIILDINVFIYNEFYGDIQNSSTLGKGEQTARKCYVWITPVKEHFTNI